jgi:PPOX class probable F420-dependent enzyme
VTCELTATARSILSGPNVAVLASLLPDGSPQTTAVWIHLEGDQPIIATTKDTLKYRNLMRDSRVAVTVFLRDDPYIELNLRGRITSIEDDGEYATLNLLSMKYYGVVPYPYLSDEQEWVKMVVGVDRIRSNKELPDA